MIITRHSVCSDKKSTVRNFMLLAAFMIFTCSNAYAENIFQTHHMRLTHHDFEPWSFKPKANDVIVITNESAIAHSVYVTHPDGTVENLTDDSAVQVPGGVITWRIPKEGEYLFQCWIHPVINEYMIVE